MPPSITYGSKTAHAKQGQEGSPTRYVIHNGLAIRGERYIAKISLKKQTETASVKYALRHHSG